MRTTITLDDELLRRAEAAAGTTGRSQLIHDGLRALIQREAALRLVRLGAAMPNIEDIPRRRPLGDDPG